MSVSRMLAAWRERRAKAPLRFVSRRTIRRVCPTATAALRLELARMKARAALGERYCLHPTNRVPRLATPLEGA